MKKLNKLNFLLLALICVSSFSIANAQCNASFNASHHAYGEVEFSAWGSTGNNLYYTWTFGDGATGSKQFPKIHKYSANGSYLVCLTIEDTASGCTDQVCDTINVFNVNSSCTADANFTTTDNGNGNFSFNKTITAASLSESLLWDFGDGNFSNLKNPNHTYTSDGTYNAILTVGGHADPNCDAIYTYVVKVNTTANPCQADANFTYTDNGNGNFSFAKTTSPGIFSIAHHWNFGDGTTSPSSTNTSHTYTTNGIYVVTLTVIDHADSNCFDSYYYTINVTGVANPTTCSAAFVMVADSSAPGQFIVFDNSKGNNLSYLWEFGDGNTSTLAHPNYTYSGNGPYELCLTVSSDSSCQSTYCDSIGSGGVVLRTTGKTGFTINVQKPKATAIEDKIDLISELNAYPNPVKNNLTIELNLTERAQVEIYVNDLLGNRIATIANNSINAGVNNIQWNTANVSNGIYLLNIESNNSIRTEKIVISK